MIKRRLALLPAKSPVPKQATSFASVAAVISLIAPIGCIVINHLCHQAIRHHIEHSSRMMLVSGIVSSCFLLVGLTLGIIAMVSGEEDGGGAKAIIGVFLNSLCALIMVFHFFTYQKMAAREQNAAPPQRRSSVYISGK